MIAVAFYSNPQASAMEMEDMSQQAYQKTISNGSYIGGGVASIFLGFGIGSAIQGRYNWVHTVTQGLCVAGLVTTGVMTAVNKKGSGASGFIYLGLAVAYSGLRIWEIIDTWMLPDNYKIVENIELSPNLYTANNGESLGLGLSLKYSF